MSKRWREFWIKPVPKDIEFHRREAKAVYTDTKDSIYTGDEDFHVIETGAVEELERKLKLAVEAINKELQDAITWANFESEKRLKKALDAINEEEG